MTSASRTVLCAKSMRLLQMNKRRRSRLLADYYHGNQNFVWFTGKKKTILKKVIPVSTKLLLRANNLSSLFLHRTQKCCKLC